MVEFLNPFIAAALNFLSRNPLNPTPPPPVVFDAFRLRQYQLAARYAADVFFVQADQPLPPLYNEPERTVIYEDQNDRALVTRREGTCYLSFAGANIRDFVGIFTDGNQGTGFTGTTQVCGSDGCCRLDRGITRAYFSDYVEQMEADTRECVASCGFGTPCPLVLTGHSQGASIAHVAAVVLADLNPILFSFGAQKMIHFSRCGVLDNMDLFFRTISQCPTAGGGPQYDVQVYLGVVWGQHTGTMILVGPGGAMTLARNTDINFFPVADECHNVIIHYIGNIDQLVPNQPFDGFVPGSLCTRDIECRSQSCDNQRCL